MITVVLFHAEGGRETVLVPGSDQPARASARQLIWERVQDDSDVYRGCTLDTLSQRFTFDSDASWYRPPVAA